MFRGDLTESAEVMKLNRELKIFERENGPAILLQTGESYLAEIFLHHVMVDFLYNLNRY